MAPPDKQPEVRLHRLAAKVTWDGQQNHAATIRFFFQFSSRKHVAVVPLLLDPQELVEEHRVVAVQGSPFSHLSDTATSGVMSRVEMPPFIGYQTSVDSRGQQVEHGAASSTSSREDSSLPDKGVVDMASGGPSSRPWLPRTDDSSNADQASKLLKSPPSSILSPPSSTTEFCYDRRGISSTRSRTPLLPFLDTSHGLQAGQHEDNSEGGVPSLASISEDETNRETSSASLADNVSNGVQAPKKHHRKRSSGSDTSAGVSRIPAPVWKDLLPTLKQKQVASTSPHSLVTSSPPRLQPSTPKLPAEHNAVRSPSPLRCSWRPSGPSTPTPASGSIATTSSSKHRKSSSAQGMSLATPTSNTPLQGGNRRRSRSVETISARSLVDDVVSFRSLDSRSGPDERSDGLNNLRTVSEAQTGPVTDRGRHVLHHDGAREGPLLNSSAQQEGDERHEAERNMAIVIRDQDGRLCIVRADDQPFEPGHYQVDLEVSQTLTQPDEENVQSLQLPSLEPSLLRGHVFHDGKLLLQVVGPWTANIMRLFSQDLGRQETADENQLAGIFKLGRIPLVQIQKKRDLDYLLLQDTRVQTVVRLSTLSHNSVRVNYEVQVCVKELAVRDLLAKDVVLEFGVSGAPLKSKVYFLEEGKSKVRLEVLDEGSNDDTETAITVCRNPRDLESMMKLRFSTNYDLSRGDHILLPTVRPKGGRLSGEAIIIRKPLPPLRAAPYSPCGAFATWAISEANDGAIMRLSRQRLPVLSPGADRERAHVRVLQFEPVADQIPSDYRTSGKPIVMNLRYRVVPMNGLFACDVEFQVSRANWQKQVEFEMRDWVLVGTVVDGRTHFLEPRDELKKDTVNWYTIRQPYRESWVSIHVSMRLQLTEQVARRKYRRRRAEGCLLLPKILDSWVLSGQVVSGIESGSYDPMHGQRSRLTSCIACVDVTTWLNGRARVEETRLTPSSPADLPCMEPSHELTIIYTAPLAVGEPLEIATLKAYGRLPQSMTNPPVLSEQPQTGVNAVSEIRRRPAQPIHVPPPPVEVPPTPGARNPGHQVLPQRTSMNYTSFNFTRFQYRGSPVATPQHTQPSTRLENRIARPEGSHSVAAAGSGTAQLAPPRTRWPLTWYLWVVVLLYVVFNVDRVSMLYYEYSSDRKPPPEVRKHVLPNISSIVTPVQPSPPSSSETVKVKHATALDGPVRATALTHQQKIELAWGDLRVSKEADYQKHQHEIQAWSSSQHSQSSSSGAGNQEQDSNEGTISDPSTSQARPADTLAGSGHATLSGGKQRESSSFLDHVDRVLGWTPLAERR